ncbi:MAG: 1-acyl-sn-glycerol-3-phosphate acyltransferase [Mangrovicoccus sp.]|nr:1-acyl-sn-glycerol-3-phosphate acyltransferase [Mangrovicoccus sp.]
MLKWLRSLFFVFQMYAAMTLMALFFTPWGMFDRRGVFAGVHCYCRYVRWSARWIVGITSEVRGDVPQDEVLIAAKHQSFFDVIIICSVVPRPKFVMKAELRWLPIVGWYARRMGCVSVKRNQRGRAMSKMVDEAKQGIGEPGQLIIYPQGTRVAPDSRLPYKPGAGVLYAQLGQICVPAATNVGLFWPRFSVMREPGHAIVEFLDPIAPGMKPRAFMGALEAQVEAASEALMLEAGYEKPAVIQEPGA